MQVVLLFDLLLNLSLHIQAHDERITLARCRGGVSINKPKSLVQVPHRFARAIDFLFDGVLEITRETLDLLSLLLEITPETRQLTDHLHLHLNGLIGFRITLSVEVSEDIRRIGQTTRLKEPRWEGLVVDDIGSRQE